MALATGAQLARLGHRVVYGGASVGLMGAVADGALDAGGEVVGVLPTDLVQRELAHEGLTELVEVASMHERKREMFERSDAFVALPGGFGTLEEVLEIATWTQLGHHDKPVLVMNHDGFYDPLLAQIERAIDWGVMRAENRDIIRVVETPAELGTAIATYERSSVPKWVN